MLGLRVAQIECAPAPAWTQRHSVPANHVHAWRVLTKSTAPCRILTRSGSERHWIEFINATRGTLAAHEDAMLYVGSGASLI